MRGYRHDHRAFGEHVLNASWMEAAMRSRAERVMTKAIAIAPVDQTAQDHYRDHFSVDSGIHGGLNEDRAYGRVVNDHPNARLLEFGTEDTPRFRTLGKALDAAR